MFNVKNSVKGMLGDVPDKQDPAFILFTT